MPVASWSAFIYVRQPVDKKTSFCHFSHQIFLRSSIWASEINDDFLSPCNCSKMVYFHRFLTNSEGDLGDVKNKDILSLNLGFKPVVSVTPETNAMEALRVLDANRVGAVAVVAKSGRLVGNFSAADMR